MGQRSISQLRFLDFIIALLIGNIIAHPLSDEGLGLKGSMITITVLVLLYVSEVLLSLKWGTLRKFFDPDPIPLIENGKINYQNLKKARISIDILLSELRKEKTEDIEKVILALWEPGGTISIFLHPQYQPITYSTLTNTLKSFSIPKPVIKDRKIDYHMLQKLGKNEKWLVNRLAIMYKAKVEDVLLATVDEKEQLNVFLDK